MTILEAVQSVGAPWLDRLALAVTHLGSESAYIAMLVVIYLAVDARAGRITALALLAGFYLNQQAKGAFDTVRPYVLHPELLRGGAAAAESGPGPAFPSGHAQGAATFWSLLAAFGQRAWLSWLAGVAIVAIATTRLYLGVHWPIDVVGGAALGLAVAGVAWGWARRGASLPDGAVVAAVVIVPLTLHLAAPTPDSGLLAGAFAGVATAPWLHRHRAQGTVPQRAGLALLGLLLAGAWLMGTSVTLPEEVKDHRLVQPARYLLLAWAGMAGAPALATRFRRRVPKARGSASAIRGGSR
jgi:undecaprenyl-diphosphatase